MKVPNCLDPDIFKITKGYSSDIAKSDLLYYIEGDEWYYLVAYHKWRNGYSCRECEGVNFKEGKTPGSRRCTNPKCVKRPDESALSSTNLEGIKISMQQVMDILCEVLLPVKEHFAAWTTTKSQQENSDMEYKHWSRVDYDDQGGNIVPSDNNLRFRNNTLRHGTKKEGEDNYTTIVLRPSFDTISKSLEQPVNPKTIEGLFNKIMDFMDKEDCDMYQRMIEDVILPNTIPFAEQTDIQQLFINFPNWFKGVKRENYGRYMNLLTLFMGSILHSGDHEGIHSKEKLKLLWKILSLPTFSDDNFSYSSLLKSFNHLDF